jgi:hypothetical protein
MRYSDLLEKQSGAALSKHEYLHGSQHELMPGTLLTPRGEAMAGVDDDIEQVLEQARPADRPKRGAVIYMARDMRTLENVARNADFIYVVTPASKVLRLDGAWINRLWQLFAENEEDLANPMIVRQAQRYAAGYWSGRRCPAYRMGHEAIWEYMTAQARVVREV